MMIDEETTSDSQGRKEMKVKVPQEYQVKLHTIKVLTGKNISAAVTEAIELYFEEGDVVPEGDDASEAAENPPEPEQ